MFRTVEISRWTDLRGNSIWKERRLLFYTALKYNLYPFLAAT